MSDTHEAMIVEQDADPLPVSPTEQRALELYDQIQELRLEIAIIKAQQSMQGTHFECVQVTKYTLSKSLTRPR